MNILSVVPWYYRWLGVGALVAAFAGFFWMKGDEHGTAKLTDYQAKEAAAAVVIVTKQGKVTEKIVTKYVAQAAKTEVVTRTVEKEVVKYVASNPGYVLDSRWGLLHDDAALGRVPEAAGGADAAAGAPTAAAALATVTANYAACLRDADRLGALQDWIREQQKVAPASK